MYRPSPVMTVMSDAAMKAGRSLIRNFGEVEKLQVSKKGPGDFVSAADTRAEEIVIDVLSKARPSYGFLAEEGEEIKGEGEYRFIIDPLDGTSNFLHGVPNFCVSIGLEQTLPNGKKEIVAGVVFAPIFNELFLVEKGKGAYLNNERLLVSSRSNLENAMVSTGGLGREMQKTSVAIAAMEALSQKVPSLRILGSAALELAYVASGRLDGFWHDNLKPWDMAAGVLLVREAKGMITAINGSAHDLQKGQILASNSVLHDRLREVLSPHYT